MPGKRSGDRGAVIAAARAGSGRRAIASVEREQKPSQIILKLLLTDALQLSREFE